MTANPSSTEDRAPTPANQRTGRHTYRNLPQLDLPTHAGANPDELLKILDALVEDFHATKIIAFGSCVKGKPGEHSDIDLCVIRNPSANCTHPRWEGRQVVARRRPRIGFDLLVLSPEQWQRQQKSPFGVYAEVAANGVTLYEG